MGLFSSNRSKTQVVSAKPITQSTKQRVQDLQQQFIQIPQHHRRRSPLQSLPAASLRLSPALPPCYEPINSKAKEIRLVQLFPGKDSDPLRCNLITTCLTSKKRLRYETASYCWGIPGQKVIEINGRPATITGTATQILHRMRHTKDVRILWIDAICINQNDKDERGLQVSFMNDIYREGSRNLVWLGNCDDNEAVLVAQTLAALVENIRRGTNGYESFRRRMHGTDAKAHAGQALDTSINLAPMQTLFCSPWYTRLWVAQEAVLAPNSLCHIGKVAFPLIDVLNAAVWLGYNGQSVRIPLNYEPGAIAARNIWYLKHPKPSEDTEISLFFVFNLAYGWAASEPRDYVYALRGLFERQHLHMEYLNSLLRPNYNKPVTEVFRDATRAIIEDTGDLRILHFVDHAVAPRGCPSWVVQFDRKTIALSDPVGMPHGCVASGRATIHLVEGYDDPNILALGGYRLDHVKQVSPIFQRGRFDGTYKAFIDLLIVMIRKGSKRSRDPWICQLAHILLNGMNWEFSGTSSYDVEDFEHLLDFAKKHPNRPPRLADGSGPGDSYFKARRFFNVFEKAMHNRRFFVTHDGYVGAGPAATRPGDAIVLLESGQVPYLLRYARGQGERTIVQGTGSDPFRLQMPRHQTGFSYVGETYMYGIMFGEGKRACVERGDSKAAFLIQ